jgi:hypothetical protein
MNGTAQPARRTNWLRKAKAEEEASGVIGNMKKMRDFLINLVLTIICLAIFSACSDDSLKQRKAHCDGYVKKGFLAKTAKSSCYTDKAVFNEGALAAVDEGMRFWYPRLLRGAEKLNTHARTYDKSKHRPLSPGTDLTLAFLETDQSKDWRYIVQLQKARISAPEETEREKYWHIAGYRNGEFHHYDILGIGVYALLDLDFSCQVFDYEAESCTATVYLDAVDDKGLLNIGAMAIELTPPSEIEARSARMNFEMRFWEPEEDNGAGK